MQNLVTDRIKVNFGDDYSVTAEISDTETTFKWRLVDSDGVETEWTGYYPGLLLLEGRKGRIGYATLYWLDYLPCQRPFQIVEGRLQ